MDLFKSLPNGLDLLAVACSAAVILLIAALAHRARRRRNRIERAKRRGRELVQMARRCAYSKSTEEIKRLPGLIKLVANVAEKNGFELWEVGASKTHFTRLLAVAGDHERKIAGDQPLQPPWTAEPAAPVAPSSPLYELELPEFPESARPNRAIVTPYEAGMCAEPVPEAPIETDEEILCHVQVTQEQLANWQRNAIELPEDTGAETEIAIVATVEAENRAATFAAPAAGGDDDLDERVDYLFDKITSGS